MRFCTYCGFALSGAPGYCGGCGAPVDQALDSGPPPTETSPVGTPPIPPPGQGPPDPWGRQDTASLWLHQGPPDPWPHQEPAGPWPYHQDRPGPGLHQDTSTPGLDQDTPGSWPRQDTSTPGLDQDTPGSWPRQDTSTPGLDQDTPGSWPRQDTSTPGFHQDVSTPGLHRDTPDPGPGRDAPDPWPGQEPVGPDAPDAFDDLFAADHPKTAEWPEFRSAALLSDKAPRRARTPRRPARSPGPRVLILATAATLAALVTGGGGAWWVANHESRVNSTSARDQSPPPRASSPVASPTPAGSNAVAIAPALAGEPDAQAVAALLKTYFAAINSHNYGTYSALFVPDIRESVQNFNAGYLSTVDSRATLVGLSSTGPQELAATVTFTSHQNPADSPNNATCDKWNVVLSLSSTGTGTGTTYLIDRSPAGYTPSVQAC
jgi:hypothetical protein